MGANFHVHSSQPAQSLGDTTLADGTPVRRFKRYGIQLNRGYNARTPNGTTELKVDQNRATAMLSTWDKIKSSGMPLKVTRDHRNRNLAENTMGDMVDVKQEGEWLAIYHDVRGQRNIEIAEANKDISVEIEPTMIDGSGNRYNDVIAAISYTPIPVVNNQPIAASREAIQDPPVFFLSMEFTMNPIQAAISKHFANGETVDDSNAVKHIEQFAAKIAAAPQAPDTRYMSLAARSVDGTFDGAVQSGVLDVATSDKLKGLLSSKTGDKREFTPLALSLSATNDEAMIDFAAKLVGIIKENKPLAQGEKTPVQMSREVPGADKEDKKKTKRKSPLTGNEVNCEPMAGA